MRLTASQEKHFIEIAKRQIWADAQERGLIVSTRCHKTVKNALIKKDLIIDASGLTKRGYKLLESYQELTTYREEREKIESEQRDQILAFQKLFAALADRLQIHSDFDFERLPHNLNNSSGTYLRSKYVGASISEIEKLLELLESF